MSISEQAASEEKEVAAVVRRFANNKFDVDGFLATWDDEAGEVLYQAEERLAPFFTLDDVKAYFEGLADVIRAVRDVGVVDYKVRLLGDVATVYTRAWCRISFARVPRPVDGQVRQSFVLRRRPDGWRIVEYHESRQAPGFEEATGEW